MTGDSEVFPGGARDRGITRDQHSSVYLLPDATPTPSLSASGLSFSEPFHTHRPAPTHSAGVGRFKAKDLLGHGVAQ
jgi:hypothetical protein